MAPAGGVIAVIGALVAALPHSQAFNIHPAPHRILTHRGARSFGHQVLQLNGSRLLVGAPAEVGGRGRLFQCQVGSGECQELELEGNSSRTHMGMALARDGDGAIACGPGLTRSCDRNVLSSGLCLRLDPRLRPRQLLAPGYQGEGRPQGPHPLQFGAVQFSTEVQPQFSLAEYAARPQPRELLRGLRQLGHLTDTFKAIAYVTNRIFTPAAGARPGARRVLIIITDGDATDVDQGSVQEAEKNDIIRYIIGVGNNFNSPDTRLYLSQFASQPSTEYVKVLDDFEKLRGLFHELQAKIYGIEGTSDHNRFHLELCSSGMSVAVTHGRRVTGAVGADNWAGGLVELEEEMKKEIFVGSPTLEENVTDTYLGYAVAGLQVPGRALVAAGAPRHRHVGAVVLFEVPPAGAGGWRALQTLPGEQVGSYFGATLCGLEQGGGAVALLVGAPNHFDGRRGGRVQLYRWQEEALKAAEELWGAPGHPLGRFGASLSALGDLDGDELPEVAVGAPMEDEERGVVYIFSGRPGGLQPLYSQRLEGQEVAPGLRFFGQALAGAMDLNGDGLGDVVVGAGGAVGDVVVGAGGAVVVLRSRPVLSIAPVVTFDPQQIPPHWLQCSGGGGSVSIRLCLGDLVTPVNFLLEAEPQRARGRGQFREGRGWSGRLHPSEEGACEEEELSLQPCIEDFVTPIRLLLTISLPHSDPPGPILRPHTSTTWIEIPFEKSCGADEVCEADLGVRALPGGAALLGVPEAELGVRLVVGNTGEDAYGAALQVQLPMGLSFRRVQATRAGALLSSTCWDTVGQPWGLSCNISRPLLGAGWEVTVELMFHIHPNASWGESVGLSAAVSSDNEPHGTMGDNAVSWDVPVSFALNLVVTWDEASTPYLNFTSHYPQNKTLQHRYRLENLVPLPHGSPQPLLTLFVLLPLELPHGVMVSDPQVQVEPGGACVAVGQEKEDAVGQELRRSITETCSTPHLLLLHCPTVPLPHTGPILLSLHASLSAPKAIQSPSRPHFCSALWVSPPPHFEVSPGFLRAQGVTEVELLRELDPRPLYVGGGVGGLLLLLLLAFGLAK
ncbi:integrin alpha-L-like, partial [Pezoporus occidentalis]|uniref:integrin alpha-L-like n=1 Tax=Pezoporus occidentalis TaxID=407982 RepID=UPI002F9195F2